MAAPSTSLERFLLRDRTIVIVSMAGLTMASWFYLLVLSSNMAEGDRSLMGMMPMGDLMAAKLQPWTPATFALMLAMWWIMMIGMMLPSAAPMVLLFARIERKNVSDRSPGVRSGFFVLGYFLIWLGFCLIATLLQWTLGETELLSTMMASTSSLLSAAIIAAAGLYQFTPLKQACLSYCRSPIQFLTTNWRIGNNGAFRMGVSHGAYCVGCCWALMALLFVAGVMNLLWVAALAIFVLLEKVALQGPWVSRVSGFAMLGVSGAVLLQAF